MINSVNNRVFFPNPSSGEEKRSCLGKEERDLGMKVTLITPCPADIAAYGVRALSAYIKEKTSHQVNLILLPGGLELLDSENFAQYRYPQKVLEQIGEICRDSIFIGISFMTNYYDRAVEVTHYLRERYPDKHISWGGTHPTIKPLEALEFADSVCLGEAEESLVELLEKIEAGKDFTGTRNFWFKDPSHPGQYLKNTKRPLLQDLDKIPPYDYELDNQYFFDHLKGEIIPLDYETFHKASNVLPYFDNKLLKSYRTMTTRGCPHRCNYCSNSWLRDMYAPEHFFRHRGPDHCIQELKDIKTRFPFIEIIQFFDDTFFAHSSKWLEEFLPKYKQEIGLPFYCQCSPATVSEKKMEMMLDAGMCYVEMGIQTGSDSIQRLYDRRTPKELIVKATQIINKYVDRLIPPTYHFIIDNPWESHQETRETIDLLTQIPKPYNLVLSSLLFYPATALLDRAMKEGLVTDELKQVYRQPFLNPKPNYLNALMYASQYGTLPNPLIKTLSTNRVIQAMDKKGLSPFYGMVFKATDLAHLLNRGRCAVMAGDFGRIVNYFRRIK